MIDVAKFPYLTARKGSSNLYYKREVPPELGGTARPPNSTSHDMKGAV